MPLIRLTHTASVQPSTLVGLPQKLFDAIGGEKSGGAKPAAAEGKKAAGVAPPATSSLSWLAGCYLGVIAGAGLAVGVWAWRNPSVPAIAAGVSVFAPLYILAQGIERLLDPLSSFVPANAPSATSATKPKKVRKHDAQFEVNKAIADGDAEGAAKWQAVVDQIRRNTGLLAWTIASVLGMLACGAFGLFMFRMVGFTAVPKWADVILSGLAVGAGTKPLHDLIGNLQAAKEGKQDPPEKAAA